MTLHHISFNDWGDEIWDICEDKGFHLPVEIHLLERSQRLMLIVSELAEAQEALRMGDTNKHNEEIADVMIRLLHYASYYHIDLDEAVADKVAINRDRPIKHGKLF